jgi:hypothetical protein
MELDARPTAEEERKTEDDRLFLQRYKSAEACGYEEVKNISRRRWSDVRAIQRYMGLAARFHAQRFDRLTPLTKYCVPWPILSHPAILTVGDVQEGSITAFYTVYRRNEGDERYTAVLKQARAMFHPDRWDSYKRYDAVADVEMVSAMRLAVLEVSKVIGNLWESLHV